MALWLTYTIEIINTILENLILILYLSKVMTGKYKSPLPYVIGIVLSTAAMSAAQFLSGDVPILFGTTIAVMIGLSLFLFSDDIKQKLFYVMIYLLIILISDQICMVLIYFLRLGTPALILEAGAGRILGMICSKLMYLWMQMLLYRFLKHKVRELPFKYWITVAVMPFISIIILYAVFSSLTDPDTYFNMFVYLMSIIGVLYFNIIMFDFFENHDSRIKLSFMEAASKREAENYKTLELSYREMQKLKHDFHNELEILLSLIAEKNYSAAKDRINELSEFIDTSAAVCYTGNEAADSLINSKISLAKHKGISVTAKINLFTPLNVSPLEYCRIIGNALDNAIEACEKVEPEKMFIFISIKNVENSVLTDISNSAAYTDTTDLSSSKPQKQLHGFGIQSIRSSAERLGGTVSFRYENGVFTFTLLTPSPCDE